MSDTFIVSILLMSREQQYSVNLREHRDIYNLLKWCSWTTFVLLIFCVFLDAYVITVLGSRYVSNHPGMRQDEVAMKKCSITHFFVLGRRTNPSISNIFRCNARNFDIWPRSICCKQMGRERSS